MDIAISTDADADGRAVVTVSGAIDVQSRSELGEAGRTALAKDPSALVLDLSDVTFLDSTGIGALVELGHDCAEHDAAFVIRHPSPRVVRVLEMTGLIDAWTVERDDA